MKRSYPSSYKKPFSKIQVGGACSILHESIYMSTCFSTLKFCISIHMLTCLSTTNFLNLSCYLKIGLSLLLLCSDTLHKLSFPNQFFSYIYTISKIYIIFTTINFSNPYLIMILPFILSTLLTLFPILRNPYPRLAFSLSFYYCISMSFSCISRYAKLYHLIHFTTLATHVFIPQSLP